MSETLTASVTADFIFLLFQKEQRTSARQLVNRVLLRRGEGAQ